MKIPKRKPKPKQDELHRLLDHIKTLDPASDEYHKVMSRIDQLDKILNRTTELKKVVIPTLATGIGVAAIYSVQQFAGVIVPKALDAIAARSASKNPQESE